MCMQFQSTCTCLYTRMILSSDWCSSLQAPSAQRHYVATCDYNPGDSEENGVSLTEGQEVELIGINHFGWWWVRATSVSSGEVEEGWVPASYLRTSHGLKTKSV